MNPRDHGYGDNPQVVGFPVVVEKLNSKCPRCGCQTMFGIEVEIGNPPVTLRRPSEPHRVIGFYIGCPACPYASPMATSARLVKP